MGAPRLTRQREAIQRALSGDRSHPSARELYLRLRRRGSRLSFATVYNNLSSLVEEGALRVIRVDRTMRFDPLIEPHSHALCDSCGSLFDVASPTPPRTRLPRGFRCRAVTVDYLGLCRSCVRKGRGAP